MTVDEVCEKLDISHQTLYKRLKKEGFTEGEYEPIPGSNLRKRIITDAEFEAAKNYDTSNGQANSRWGKNS